MYTRCASRLHNASLLAFVWSIARHICTRAHAQDPLRRCVGSVHTNEEARRPSAADSRDEAQRRFSAVSSNPRKPRTLGHRGATGAAVMQISVLSLPCFIPFFSFSVACFLGCRGCWGDLFISSYGRALCLRTRKHGPTFCCQLFVCLFMDVSSFL